MQTLGSKLSTSNHLGGNQKLFVSDNRNSLQSHWGPSSLHSNALNHSAELEQNSSLIAPVVMHRYGISPKFDDVLIRNFLDTRVLNGGACFNEILHLR